MRKLLIALAVLIPCGALVPSQAQAAKPEIVYVRATADEGGIRFSAKVNMDKHSRNLREVDVTYEGETKNAEPLRQHLLSFYETDVFNAPTRNCYRVTVKARNKFGTTVETVRAGRLGTDGCN